VLTFVATTSAGRAADLSLDRAAGAPAATLHHHRRHHMRVVIRRDSVAAVLRTVGMRFEHQYGPGPLPGMIATYDGSLRSNCAQRAASYLGRDGRRHACAYAG